MDTLFVLSNRLRRFVVYIVPAVILAAGLVVSTIVGQTESRHAADTLTRDFEFQARDISDNLENRLKSYEQVLRGVAGLFASSPAVLRSDFRSYIRTLRIDENYPGIQALGFSFSIAPDARQAHIDAIRAEGYEDYTIHPDGARDQYTSVVYLEPFSGRNLRAFGYDMYAEPVHRAAMEKARDENRTALSGKVTLAQETDAAVQAGFLMYIPVYRNGPAHDSLAERRRNLVGWASASFRADDLMAGLGSRRPAGNPTPFDVLLFDGDSVNSEDLMFHFDHDDDRDPVLTGKGEAKFLFRKTISLGSHSWTVVVHTPSEFDSGYWSAIPLRTQALGGLLSLLAAILAWVVLQSRMWRDQPAAPAHGAALHAGQRPGSRRSVALPYASAMLLTVLAAFAVVTLDDMDRQEQARAERGRVQHELDRVRLELEQALSGSIMRTRGVAAQIIAHGDVTEPQFARIASVLMAGNTNIRNMTLSRGTVIERIYPLAGNERAIGTDYKTVPFQWTTVRRAIETRTPQIQGPVELIQGGNGLIVRDPVFLPDPLGGENRLFGMVSLVLDTDRIFAGIGIGRNDMPIGLAIRGRDGQGVGGEMISGDEAIFSRRPVEADVVFPYGSWRLAAQPRDGWGAAGHTVSMSRVLNGSLFVFVVLVSFGTARTITERERLQDALSLSGERIRKEADQFQSLLHIASDGIHILDEDGNLLQFSKAFIDMLGYSAEHARTLNVKDWDVHFDPADLPGQIRGLIDAPAIFETRHRRRDGTVIDVEINARGIEHGGRKLLYASSRDVSERKRWEVALIESEARFRLMADSAPVLIWVAGRDTLCFWFNRTWLDFTGRTMEQEAGNGWTEGVHADDLPHCLDIYLAAFERHEPFAMEYRLRRFDGEYRWLLDTGVPRLDDHGNFTGYIGSCIDVTNHRLVEIALKESESRLRQREHDLQSILNTLPSMIGYWDRNLRNRFANPAYRLWFGLEPGEIPGRHIREIIGEARYALNLPYIEAVLRGEPQVFERAIPTPDGSGLRHSLAHYIPDIEGGEVLGFYVLVSDITAVKVAEAKVHELLEFNTRIVEDSPSGIAVYRDDGTCVMVNPSLARMAGMNEDEFRARTLSGLPDWWVADARTAARAALESGEQRKGVYRVVSRSGRDIWIECVFKRLIYDGRAQLLVLVSDNSERMRAEQVLRERQEVFEKIFVGSVAVMLLIDPADGRIVDANPAAAGFYGWSLSRLRSLSISDVNVLSAEETKVEMERAHREERQYFLFRHRLASGEIRDVEVYSSPLMVGCRSLLLSLVHDVTRRRMVEDALQQKTAELERSNAELEAFAYVASHDLRQPLRSISSYVQLLQHDLGPTLDGDSAEYFAFVRNGALRMDRLIVALLEYSRVGRRTKTFVPCPATDIIESALINLDAAIREASAAVTVDPHLPSLLGDGDELTRLFQNIIGNAIKYRAAERPPAIHVGCAQGEGGWHFTVRDNGIGIAAEYFERVFGIFQRLHRQGEYEGTGVGLAISKKVVEHHGGRIWIESEPDVGSTFHIVLPRRDEPAS
jgi:PAS domain S-box-containing protein